MNHYINIKANIIVLINICLGPIYAMNYGNITAYGDSWQGNECGFNSIWDSMESTYGQKYFAAINDPQWSYGLNCGRCVSVQCTSSECKSLPPVTLLVINRCPECHVGSLDVSDTAFKAITGKSPAVYNIQWEYVDCPINIVNDKMEIFLKAGSNLFWTAFQPRNFGKQISKLIFTQNNSSITLLGPESNHIDGFYFLLQKPGGITTNSFTITTYATDNTYVTSTHNTLWTAGTSVQTGSQFTGASDSRRLRSIKGKSKHSDHNRF